MLSNKCVCILLISLGVYVNGQIPSLGFCPDYLPMSEFDMNRFLGKWYEAERYFTFSEVVSRCVVTDYAKATSGRIYVSNEVTNRLTGVKRIINGNLQLVGKGDEGKLNVKYATTPIPTESTLMILETDYDNYAVIWSCNGFGPVHAQNAWLMTRERLPSGVVLQKAYGILDKFKISRTFFVKTDQEGCALAASDINAANGITATSTVAEATGADQRNADIANIRSALPITDEKATEEIQPTINQDVIKEAIIKEESPVDLNKKASEQELIKDEKLKNPTEEITKDEKIDDKAELVKSKKNAVTIPEHILKEEKTVKKNEDDLQKNVVQSS